MFGQSDSACAYHCACLLLNKERGKLVFAHATTETATGLTKSRIGQHPSDKLHFELLCRRTQCRFARRHGRSRGLNWIWAHGLSFDWLQFSTE